jgi:hypothetical protein
MRDIQWNPSPETTPKGSPNRGWSLIRVSLSIPFSRKQFTGVVEKGLV